MKLTKQEQACFDAIKYGGYLCTFDAAKRSVINPNIPHLRQDKWGRWHQAFHHYPKRIADSLVSKGLFQYSRDAGYFAADIYIVAQGTQDDLSRD